ncbi:gap junction delta-4 protein [Rhinatrema bivittatum]|uniref:gap junction delta-4 protein n=1 Tax=Rhinatrema bivittatum TaxID=194408 RepID=UPI0011287BDB|nr:gap junction delta-4 protein [Rhinatrema bivittatum]
MINCILVLQIIIVLSFSVFSFVGKLWLALMTLLRLAVIVLAGYSLYQDEQERFICNTLQPGCSNVCYDAFSPVSHFRFWLMQTLCVLLPYVMFSIHILHHVSLHIATGTYSCKRISHTTNPTTDYRTENMDIQDFSGAYIIHLLLRTITEAGFSAGQYFLFGVFVPQSFSCHQPPCTGAIDCYISRPTEKSIMVIFVWGISGISIFLSVVDLICVIQSQIKEKNHRGESLRIKNTSVQEELYSTTIKQHVEYQQAPEEDKHHPLLCDPAKGKGSPKAPPSLVSDPGATDISLYSEAFTHDTATSNINTNSNKKIEELQGCPSLNHPIGNAVAACRGSDPQMVAHRQAGKKWHDKNPPFRTEDVSPLPYPKLGAEGYLLEGIQCDVQFHSSNTIKATKSQWV